MASDEPNSKAHDELVLVTGGAGYIGSVLVRKLLARQYRVRVLDSLLYGTDSLEELRANPNFEFIHGDIADANCVSRALLNVKQVVHLAALVGDPACVKNPSEARQTNRDGSLRIIEASERVGVKRFVFASTCSNYGKMSGETGWVTESSPLNPVSLYAELKVEVERHLLDYHGAMSPVVLRFATAFGHSPRLRFDLTVNEFTAMLFLHRKLDIYGEQFWRPYCHTSDLSEACILALESPIETVSRQAFNVGSNSENFQKSTLADMIIQELPDRGHLISYVHREEDPRDYRVSFKKIEDDLGFAAKVSVRDGIKEIIAALTLGTLGDIDNPQFRNS